MTDTVKVGPEKGVCLTEGLKSFKDILFSFEDENPKAKPKANGDSAKAKARASEDLKGVQAGSKVLRAKTRQQFLDPEASTSLLSRITAHQKELHGQRQEEGIARFAGEDHEGGKEDGKSWKKFQSYKGEAGLPKEAESLKVRGPVEVTPTFLTAVGPT